ncbi:iron-containing alcohol dehydrogenase [Clostridium paraputrificum]|uniref:iron-containing alcohol dehydrogenase n=1 Tax=Clostridium paraputrificum TaxID=29363 RepID=UPI0006C14401|nr:iron-containing alcohol dehydrogenase [Clostridium paraputrificum]CUO20504.1 iron-containing alcohol dehydrogenase [Clostridium paraputrificum]
MARFTLPRDIYHGEGALEVLKTLKGKKAFIVVGGGSMKRFGFLQKAEEYLKEAGMEVELYEGVEPDPSVETVMKGAEAMRKFEPDWIVSMGGGSAIDAAKAMWIFYEYPDFTFEEAIVPFGLPELRQKAKFVAIPSTSGTATEVTAFSVITNYTEKIKYPLADFNITPDIAIVDPTLAQTMPKKLVAHTGMDALTHAIEAYTASLKSNFSDPLAMKAIEMVRDNLVESYKGDEKARSSMHDAQCLAGMAFSNALLGIVHSMAHKVGAVFHIPHGCANAIFLPYVIQYNRKNCEDRYGDIAKMLKLEGNTDVELTDSLIKMIDDMNDKLAIPHTMKEYGIAECDFNDNLKFISHNAVLDACTGSNPREIDDETMEKLFKCTYYGDKVEF